MTPQARYLALLAAERDRRDPNGGEDARQQLLDMFSAMAERFAATARLHPVNVDDMSPAEMIACHLLPEHLRPAGLKPEAEIWAEVLARQRNTYPIVGARS
jgi:hypothetical protein